jgi:membrane protein implicated in regulation of membrane protease activity
MSKYDTIALVMTLAILSSTSVVIAWMFLRRRTQPSDKGLPSGAERRLERIEQAVDAMAIEVERISEGQRYLTGLMAAREREPAGLPSAPNAEHSA